MRILVTGANGFIGSAIVCKLLAANHKVICAVRKKSAYLLNISAEIIECDFNQDIVPDSWLPRLKNIDIVINCAGLLQSRKKQSISAINQYAPIALFKACEQAGVKRIIQVSALGADAEAGTAFAITKKAAEDYLKNLDKIDWVILRPSLVYGTGSYGGTSLFRGLAGLPKFIPVPGDGMNIIQPIFIDDLAQTILIFTEKSGTIKDSFDVVGPERVDYKSLIMKLRNWLQLPKAKFIAVPIKLLKILAKINDILNLGPVNSTSLSMLLYGNTTSDSNEKKFLAAINFKPRAFTEMLATLPSYVQDRWHARLYFLKPLLRLTLSMLWIGSGLAALLMPSISYPLLAYSGLHGALASLVLYGTSIIDIILGSALLANFRVRDISALMLIISIIYTIVCAFTLPELWLEPLAPLLKNFPIIIATGILWAIAEDR